MNDAWEQIFYFWKGHKFYRNLEILYLNCYWLKLKIILMIIKLR